MYFIKNEGLNKITINKSDFICIIKPIHNLFEIKMAINEAKKTYNGATHYCYAYILGNNEKYNDDGEPSGTAGNPILNVIKNKNLNNIIVIVIRYFGGIKLGAGGLVRAYTKAVTECLKTVELKVPIEYINIDIYISYENANDLYKYINDEYIKSKEFNEKIKFELLVPTNIYEKIKSNLKLISLDIIEKEITIQ